MLLCFNIQLRSFLGPSYDRIKGTLPLACYASSSPALYRPGRTLGWPTKIRARVGVAEGPGQRPGAVPPWQARPSPCQRPPGPWLSRPRHWHAQIARVQLSPGAPFNGPGPGNPKQQQPAQVVLK